MVGVGMEPPAPPAEATSTAVGLAARGVRPRRVSAKRSWPPGCGRFPAPVRAAAAGDGEKDADCGAGVFGGRTDEAFAPAAVSPVSRNGYLPQRGPNKVIATAAVLSVAQNSGPPQEEQNKVEELVAPAAVSPAACNGAPIKQEPITVDELSATATVSHAMSNGTIPQALPERAGEDGDRGENGDAQLLGDAAVLSLDGQEGNGVGEMVVLPVGVSENCDFDGAGSYVQNGGEGAGLLVVEKCGGGSEVVWDCAGVAGDGNGRENGNKADGSELERKENGVEGSRTKRWLMSVVNPPPKRRAVSAVRRFPPGCGKASVIKTKENGVLEVSPVCSFHPGCASAVSTEFSGVLEASPIRTFPPGIGRSTATTTNSGDQKGLQVEAAPATNDDAVAAIPVAEGTASPTLVIEASNEKFEGKAMVNGNSKAHDRVNAPNDIVGAKEVDGLRQNVVAKAKLVNGFNEKTKQAARNVVDDKMKCKLEGSSQKSTLRTPLSDPIDAKTKGKRLESDKMNSALLDKAEASSRGKMQSKALNTKKEVVRSNVNMKQDKLDRRLKGDGTGKDTWHRSVGESFGKRVGTKQGGENGDMNLIPNQVIVQALMAPDKCPWRKGRKSIASASKSLTPRNKQKGKNASPKKPMLEKKASPNEFYEAIEGNEDSYLEGDDNSRALVVYEEKKEETKELCVTIPPSVPSGSHHELSGDHDARSKVRKLLQKFHGACRKLMQVEEQHLQSVGRIDIEAVNALKKDPIYIKPGPIVGNVPGVEVGDEFHYRVELSLVGLHRPYQAGIDTCKVNGVPVAISIVASGGYPDELSSSDEMIYTGSGGKAIGKKGAEDQKLERGNLALKNCIETKTPVRVIHGFKGQSRGEIGHSKGKQVSTFTYDGLYMVVDCWQDGPKGSMVFKYKLQRIPGQPELSLHIVKLTRKSKVREGLCLPDMSLGNERIPICVINTIDDMRPAPFKYITKIIYPPWYEKEAPTGCDCTNGCSDSVKCACAMKNGGEIPYNFNGAIVEAKPLIYECGPSCRCPPTCHNRVSQHGVKILLEIFKTGKTGWGVRSLSSISSGTFICEYVGELLDDKEAEKRENDEYLFDIGSNYHDEELWEGLKSIVPVQSSTSTSKTMEGFTIDAAECGNVGRFINHSCSPNLYAQNVLWDHDDMRMPHVMLYAVENIPPLQELTYHYNYEIGQVHKNGEEKVKHCFCGSPECCGRLY